MDLKDTELTLGLPGTNSKSSSAADYHHVFNGGFNFNFNLKSSICSSSSMKRGFMETVDQVDHLKSSTSCFEPRGHIKVDGKQLEANDHSSSSSSSSTSTTAAPAVKSAGASGRVVGWPPVRSLRQKALVESEKSSKNNKYVKVGADGAPYLRKLDLEMYKGYHELLRALHKMFTSLITINGKYMEEDSNIELIMKPEVKGMDQYVLTYEDKDGDWMLVGDVPWKMFIESCKRIRLMKSSEAVGIAPRTQTLPQSTSYSTTK